MKHQGRERDTEQTPRDGGTGTDFEREELTPRKVGVVIDAEGGRDGN